MITGISLPYDEAFKHGLIVDTEVMNSQKGVKAMLAHLAEDKCIKNHKTSGAILSEREYGPAWSG